MEGVQICGVNNNSSPPGHREDNKHPLKFGESVVIISILNILNLRKNIDKWNGTLINIVRVKLKIPVLAFVLCDTTTNIDCTSYLTRTSVVQNISGLLNGN
jgi:hypothetical protein